MMRVVAFLSRGCVFALITAVGFSVLPTEDLLVDRNLRLSISALQVFVLATIQTLYIFVSTILHVIRQTTPIRFARIDEAGDDMAILRRMASEISVDSEQGPSPRNGSVQGGVGYSRTTEADATGKGGRIEDSKGGEGDDRDRVGVRDVLGAVPEMSDALSENMSLHESLMTAKEEDAVSFNTQGVLDWYILRVHLVGLALWQTFLCFDCTSRDIDISFITGLVMGWFFVHVRNKRYTCPQNACAIYYMAMLCTVILSEEHIFATALPPNEYHTTAGRVQLYFNICVLPFITGVFWVVISTAPACDLVLDARRSVVTFLLISLTFPLYWTRIDINMVQACLGALPHLSVFGILILSPIFKFISIYIMLLSLQKQHALDLILALAAVLCFSSAVLNDMDTVLLVRIVITAVLLTGHVTLMHCTACKGLMLH